MSALRNLAVQIGHELVVKIGLAREQENAERNRNNKKCAVHRLIPFREPFARSRYHQALGLLVHVRA